MTQIIHFSSIEEFYDKQGGRFSGERDFGVMHYDDMELFPFGPGRSEGEKINGGYRIVFQPLGIYCNGRLRVSVVDETGDVYAIQQGYGDGLVVMIGNVGVNNPDFQDFSVKPGPVYERAEELLDGWANNSGGGRSISWFVNRLKDVHSPTESASATSSPWCLR